MKRQQQGFTLLEVMVALAILAVVAVSASKASRSYLQSVDNMKTRTFAYYVAQNTLADLRMTQTWLTTEETRQIDAQGRHWQVMIFPQPNSPLSRALDSANTAMPIQIQVAPVIEGVKNPALVSIDAVLVKQQPEILP